MRRHFLEGLLAALFCSGCLAEPIPGNAPPRSLTDKKACVIVLHGLARSRWSMVWMARGLEDRGFRVWNVPYPSTTAPIERLAQDHLAPAVERCREAGCQTIHLVGHSLGGILARQYLQTHALPAGSRLVMLSPPNQGSRIAEILKDYRIFRWVIGPAGQQLGTGEGSMPRKLAPVDVDVGVIAGNRSWNPVFSYLIPGPDDGQVAVSSTRLAEMTDFIVIPASHTFIMFDREVVAQTAHFLRYGRFRHEAQPSKAGEEK